jgi:hypothetical protein
MQFLRDSLKVLILDNESFAFEKLIFRLSWSASPYAGFILRRVLELKFEGKRRIMVRPSRRWFIQLVTDKETEIPSRNRKVKTEDFSTIEPYKIEALLEEEEDYDDDDMDVLI